MSRYRSRQGFTLIEIMVVLGVVAIMAGMLVPLTGKILDQRRTAATRKNLRLAFEAMFGSHHRHVPNMRADFGFNPTESLLAIPCLVRNCWPAQVHPDPPLLPLPPLVPSFGKHDGSAFAYGYNGPYWQGPVIAGNPVDAWGSPIRLICGFADPGIWKEPTWQLCSLGPDRKKGNEEVDDDLYYPSTPVRVSSYESTLNIHYKTDKLHMGNHCTFWIQGVRPDGTLGWLADKAITSDKPADTIDLDIPSAGTMTVMMTYTRMVAVAPGTGERKETKGGPFVPRFTHEQVTNPLRVIHILPGEKMTVEITF